MRKSKGMTTLEYSVLVMAIMLAFFAMLVPLRRAVSSRWKVSADTFGTGRQYESSSETSVVRN